MSMDVATAGEKTGASEARRRRILERGQSRLDKISKLTNKGQVVPSESLGV